MIWHQDQGVGFVGFTGVGGGGTGGRRGRHAAILTGGGNWVSRSSGRSWCRRTTRVCLAFLIFVDVTIPCEGEREGGSLVGSQVGGEGLLYSH